MTDHCICGCKKQTPTQTHCDWCLDPRNLWMIQALGAKYPGFFEPHVSPSQLATYIKNCRKKWALDKIGKVPRGSNRFADRGRCVHKHEEDWIGLAKPIDLCDVYGQIAFPAIKHLPAPLTPGLVTEREIRWYPEGVGIGNLWVFQKDLEYPSPDTTWIWDYKSFSREVFNLTPADLLDTDPQGICYAAHAFLVYQCRSVVENWLYLAANKPYRCIPVEAIHDRDHCLARFAELDAVATEMLDHRRASTDPQSFAPETKGCPAYGGCPYRNTIHCNITDEQYLMSQINQAQALVEPGDQLQNFLAQIGATPAPAPQPVIPPPQPQPVAVQQPVYQAPQPQPVAIQQPPSFPGLPMPAPQMQVPVFAPQPAQPAAVPAFLAAPPVPPGTPVQLINNVSQPPSIQTVVAEAPATAVGSKSRTRRTKAQMQAAAQAATPVETPPTDWRDAPNMVARAVGEDSLFKADENGYLEDPTGVMFVKQVAIAMAQNPGYCALDSVSFAERARVLAQAVEAL